LQIDEPLVQELVRLRDLVKPQEILLVLDAATGQEAVNVATHFDQALNITGSILTKLDGDARGGAALEHEVRDRQAHQVHGRRRKARGLRAVSSRAHGVAHSRHGRRRQPRRKAAEAVELEDAKRMEEKMRKGEFTLEDFLEQLRQMKKLGPLEASMKMLPGGAEG
jgi:signal recognition particle subunit SRP54